MSGHASRQRPEGLAYTERIADAVREPLIALDKDLRVKTANRSFYRTFQVTPAETESCFLYDLGSGQWNIPQLRELLEEILPQNTSVENFEVDHVFPSIGQKVMLLNARRIHYKGTDTELILLAMED